jgi:hypothetical protein
MSETSMKTFTIKQNIISYVSMHEWRTSKQIKSALKIEISTLHPLLSRMKKSGELINELGTWRVS